MKLCTKCCIEKPFTEFSIQKNGKYGLKSWCKDCAYNHTPSWIAPYDRKVWQAWCGIFVRTRYKRDDYPHYQTIKVHVDFSGRVGFFIFANELGKCPGPEYSVDRINNEKDYEPGNIRWADKYDQANNTSKGV